MKRLITGLSILLLIAIGAVAYAEDTGGGRSGLYCPYCGHYLGPRGGYHGMGAEDAGSQGMMGKSYGMGSSMMGSSYGGYGMGPGMLGGEMMGPGYYGVNRACQKFLDETVGLRKELYNKRYEYNEAFRNPKIAPETTEKLQKDLSEVEKNIYSKSPQGCTW